MEPLCLSLEYEMWYIEKTNRMRQKVLNSAAMMFTNNWVRLQKNPKLYGFSDDAEVCRKRVLIYAVVKYLFLLSTLMACAFLFFNFLKEKYDLRMITLLGFQILISTVGFILATKNKPGDTRTQISKQWSPVRSKLLKYGVISWIVENQKEQNFVGVSVPRTPKDRPLLVRALDESMKAMHEKRREYQKNGFPKEEAKILAKMEDLASLPEKFGIKMDFSSYGIGQKIVKEGDKVTVRVTLVAQH